MTGDVRPKALAALRDGRVQVVLARCTAQADPPFEVCAWVQSSRDHGPRHVVDFLRGDWGCTCQAGRGCAHIAAVQLVTGHVSAAAKQVLEQVPA